MSFQLYVHSMLYGSSFGEKCWLCRGDCKTEVLLISSEEQKAKVQYRVGDNVNIKTYKATLKDQPCIPFNIGTIKEILTRPNNDNF